ncbi:S-adenosylmethionine:tRNA ribosyltransferase-isomerase [Nocardia huaxiensis]|uniref:S-adenosylmethionine:tRNA ribosyltransferase-isomerase n=1 Tax=Nocardia huaxiensis TaxID=2755382 RepID=UPI001E3B4410|nr:S-adenosylmethionine:tRNA ribosyltransferase-isomerase [Nocardia huaxiensis]UFS96342.1 S-adenosylmethionine:tRNA ribosyltransferase-isomerase [Nocardia huaxiensis]
MTVDLARHEFVVPAELTATSPPEVRGLARDEVRLLLSDGGTITHARFRELPSFLRPGDLVVVNNSAMIPAAVDARLGGAPAVVHFSTRLDDGRWVLELRDPRGTPWSAGSVPDPRDIRSEGRESHRGATASAALDADRTSLGARADGARPGSGAAEHARTAVEPGVRVGLAGGHSALLLAPWLPGSGRLWVAEVDTDVPALLARYGRPITYSYVCERWSASYYRTVFGREPGSAEMPSAGRPFTEALVTELVASGVGLAPITLHAGVSSPEAGEPPSPERFTVPEITARLVNATHAAGGRVVAVGTTVTRALESATDTGGSVRPRAGWTDLVLGGCRPARAVDGLITGWHEAGASHLQLLESVAGADVVRAAYRAALDTGYLWHEFGDTALLFRS